MGLGDVPTFPVELLLDGRAALIVGASPECLAKVDRLLGSGARVTIVSEAVPVDVEALATNGTITWHARPFTPADLDGVTICFVGPEHADLGAELAEHARVAGTLVCTLDRPEHATFVNPGVVRTGGIQIAIASGGRAPAVVRVLREQLERTFGDTRFAAFVRAVGARRAEVPRGERSTLGRELVRGLGLEVKVTYPDWFV